MVKSIIEIELRDAVKAFEVIRDCGVMNKKYFKQTASNLYEIECDPIEVDEAYENVITIEQKLSDSGIGFEIKVEQI